MKALVATPYYYPKVGGLENYARQLNRVLISQEGWSITVVTSSPRRRASREIVDGHPVYRLGTWFKISNTPFNPLWRLQLRAVIAREQPDIIIAHAPVPSFADAAVRAKGKTPFILVYHAATLLKAGSPLFNLAARVYGLIGNTTLRRSDKIFAVSPYVRQQFSTHLQRKTVVVPNAVAAHDIRRRSQPVQPEFIFIASLDRTHSWKGLEQVLEAVAYYRDHYSDDVRLTVIGDGTMRAEYEWAAASLGLGPHVGFLGALDGPRKIRVLRRALGMIIYPRTENDAFPTVMLEAWANYVPVIGARIGAVATLIHDGQDGLLCEPLRPVALAATMRRLVAMSPEARAQLAQCAASRTRRHYTWERQAHLVNQEAQKLV